MRLGALLFGAVLVLGATATASAQGGYDPYYGGGRDDRKQERRAEKRHRKAEKEALKRRQREEREELKRQRRAERDDGYYDDEDSHRDDGYYDGEDDYYGDGGYDGGGEYSGGDRQAVFDSGYRDGLRAGREDLSRNRQYDYERHSAYRNASAGDRGRDGAADAYRDGFRRGYEEGYRDDRNRRSTGGGWAEILGGILGRP